MSETLIGSKIKFLNEDIGVSLPEYQFDIDFDGKGVTRKVKLLLGHSDNLYHFSTDKLVGKIINKNEVEGTCDIAWGEGYPKKLKPMPVVFKPGIITTPRTPQGSKQPSVDPAPKGSKLTKKVIVKPKDKTVPANKASPKIAPTKKVIVKPKDKIVSAKKASTQVSEPASPQVSEPASPQISEPASPQISEQTSSQVSEPASPQISKPVLPKPAPKPKLIISKKNNNSNAAPPSKKKPPTLSAPSKKKPGPPPVPSVETTVKPNYESGSEESSDYDDEEFESDSD